MQMRCNICGHQLDILEEENKLNEEDLKRCREAIDSIMKEIRKFDNYVVPQNFFGEGKLSAYVSPTTTQHIEDLSNVNFQLKIGNEFHGFMRKQKMPMQIS